MITNTCCKCRKSFPLGEARLDEHWNEWSSKPAYASCPHCDERLDGVHFNSVHVARGLTWHNLSLAAIGFGLSALGLATGTLSYVGPAMIAVRSL